MELDSELAQVPVGCLPLNVRSGIAPAMKANGATTYWGSSLDDTINDKTKKLLGCDAELTTPGHNYEITRARQEAADI